VLQQRGQVGSGVGARCRGVRSAVRGGGGRKGEVIRRDSHGRQGLGCVELLSATYVGGVCKGLWYAAATSAADHAMHAAALVNNAPALRHLCMVNFICNIYANTTR
jgi:hypothetical protein